MKREEYELAKSLEGKKLVIEMEGGSGEKKRVNCVVSFREIDGVEEMRIETEFGDTIEIPDWLNNLEVGPAE